MTMTMRYKLQRLCFGAGPWVDDVRGSWVEKGNARVWVPGLALSAAEAILYVSETARQRGNARIPPRRIVPFDHQSPSET